MIRACLFFLMILRPPRSTLFPYTSLCRSLIAVDAADRFLGWLNGIVDPEEKRRTVGAEFIAVFAEEARKLGSIRSEEHTSELQSRQYLVCRLLLEKKNKLKQPHCPSCQLL